MKVCRETIALLYSELDKWHNSGGLLAINFEEYEVVSWSPSQVVAIAKPRAADLELRISVEHESAERTYRETEARGAKGASPIPVRWVLK
jgi:hypothetical protein